VTVVVTSIVSIADWVPSLTVKTQWPAAAGVTLNVPPPLGGETVAIPLHELVPPLAAVLTVNVPANPASVAVKLCAAPAPVATNESPDGARPIADGVAVGAGVAVGVGGGTVLPVPPDPLQPTMSTAKTHTEKPRDGRIAGPTSG